MWIVALTTLLAEQLNIPESQILAILQRAPLQYKVYKIPKRTFGVRTIAQPTPALKSLQRAFLASCPLPVHSSATAYRPGLGIKENARQHQRNKYLLKLDLNNFFNSITPDIFWQEWQHCCQIPAPTDKTHIEHLLFWAPRRLLGTRLALSVGAPSSPSVSNFIMYRFDERILQHCQKLNITYTRYADDLTFSTNTRNALFPLPEQIAQILDELFTDRISINKRKTVFSSRAHNRHVTGICLTSEDKLSLGRAKKRYLKHLVHQFILGSMTPEQVRQLQGWLAHAQHIEPTFIGALTDKYGAATLKKIREACND